MPMKTTFRVLDEPEELPMFDLADIENPSVPCPSYHLADVSGSVNVEDAPFVDVGGVYLVNVVDVPKGSRRNRLFAGEVIPVLGERHEDKSLGFPWQHWHVDWRFVGHALFEHCRSEVAKATFDTVPGKDPDRVIGLAVVEAQPLGRRPLEYKRKALRWPNDPQWLPNLERTYRDAIADCNTCPHRGISLTGAPNEPEAGERVRVCPGHGLAWSTRTNRLVPRTTGFRLSSRSEF